LALKKEKRKKNKKKKKKKKQKAKKERKRGGGGRKVGTKTPRLLPKGRQLGLQTPPSGLQIVNWS
jgi:hypothetical protein